MVKGHFLVGIGRRPILELKTRQEIGDEATMARHSRVESVECFHPLRCFVVYSGYRHRLVSNLDALCTDILKVFRLESPDFAICDRK